MMDPLQGNEGGTGRNVGEFTVSEISQKVKRLVEDQFGYVRVRGEISGYRGPHSSGHCYFALKDEGAKIDAIVWRGVFGKLRFKPEEGMEVIATGKLTTYPGKSSYQIVIDALEPAGVGALMALLEERKRKLAAEGLFAAERKRALPFLPHTIGVVTSPTGAVIRDILHRLADRFPRNVLVWPVRVQGETSAAEVAAAIRGFNSLDPKIARKPDVIIVARGGGSIEELWGFNEEDVVRAVAESGIPVISAVGHETDWTLIDLVADLRAPTPTAAAELAVPVRTELLATIDDLARRRVSAMARLMDARRQAMRGAARGLPRLADLLALPRQRFDLAAGRLAAGLRGNIHAHALRLSKSAARLTPLALRQRTSRDRVHVADLAGRGHGAVMRLIDARRREVVAAAKLFHSLSYKNVLARGYALVRDGAGQVIRSAQAVSAGSGLQIELADGTVAATVNGAAPGKPGKKPSAPKPPGKQESLF